MALRSLSASSLRLWTNPSLRSLGTTAPRWRRAPPLGPMPNEQLDVSDLEHVERYNSYIPYVRRAQQAQSAPVWWKTYRSYMEKEDPEHGVELVDIGLPLYTPRRHAQLRERRRVMKENKKNVELERAARLRTFRIPLQRVQEAWEQTGAAPQLRRLASHYGVFRDLFPSAHFLPQVLLRISHGQDGPAQVHYGNRLTPSQAGSAPQVTFQAEDDSLWTLLLTCPDEHLVDSEGEYVHWLVGNIRGSAVQEGEELCHYLPPFPPRGTGFHRYVYVLFRQDGHVDFESDRRPSPCLSLPARTFSTVEFYRRHQEALTPAGLSFFQSSWDPSVSHTFHHALNMREPVFEFQRPPVYHPPQVKFPHRQPLRYLDRYRDGRPLSYGIY